MKECRGSLPWGSLRSPSLGVPRTRKKLRRTLWVSRRPQRELQERRLQPLLREQRRRQSSLALRKALRAQKADRGRPSSSPKGRPRRRPSRRPCRPGFRQPCPPASQRLFPPASPRPCLRRLQCRRRSPFPRYLNPHLRRPSKRESRGRRGEDVGWAQRSLKGRPTGLGAQPGFAEG